MNTLSTSLGDRRLNQRFYELQERICNRLSVVVREISENRAQEVAFGRLLRHSDICASEIAQMGVEFSMKNHKDRPLLLIQDSSELSFGLDPFQKDLSKVGGGQESGFYVHPVIALDAESHVCMGLANVEVFKRAEKKIHRNNDKYENKQSYRWLSSIKKARINCKGCGTITVISDREGDIYDAMCGYKSEEVNYVIRSWHDRPLLNESQGCKLYKSIDEWEVKGQYRLDLPRTDKRSAHEALLEVKFGKISIKRPEKGVSKHLPPNLEIFAIEVKENPSSTVNNETPVHWRLVTSHEVTSLDQARMIVQWYTRRWFIEQVFRLLKKQGLDITESQSHTYKSLSKLAIMGIVAAVRVLQLVTGRDNPAQIKAEVAFTEQEIQILHNISPTLEGKTDIQKNPHPKGTLAFAAWVIARLGGWKGYSKSERPPGPITFNRGLKRLQNYYDIYYTLKINPRSG